ncbi:MAG: leucine-rich repeat protein, partial [Clostridia bacterium]|nr:leucine-rich repeat protein [Clostridia bacterium]
MLALFCIGNTEADAVTYSGDCGDNVKWSLDTDTGVLSITGSGVMANYSSSWNSLTERYETTAPWGSYINSIKTVKIGDSVTSIGSDAFSDCTSLTSVTIPDS